MSQITRIREQCRHCLPAIVVVGSVLYLSFTAIICAAEQQYAASSIESLISDVKKGEFTRADLDRLARARAVQAIPALKEQFDKTTDISTKEALASALNRLGDKEQIYWNFLEKYARLAVESDAPFPNRFDSQGKIVSRELSAEFLAWTKAHRVSTEEAIRTQMREFPSYLLFLAVTGDKRGQTLLREAMSSPNYLLQAVAAKGLAKLQDEDSVPLIIEACEKAPAEMTPMIAYALVFMDDSRAQAASERFIPDHQVLEELRKVSREKGVDALL